VKRLYARLYLALLASLTVFAVAAAALWHASGGWEERQGAVFAQLAANVLPPASAGAAEQQAAVEKIAAGIPGQFALLAADGRRLAVVGADPGRGAHRLQLPDGRSLVVRPQRRGLLTGVAALALLLVAVGAGAYPVVRRLTRRIERLQTAVESLGSGQLSARVEVKGRDEVAALAESFNAAAARIEALVAAHRSLLANTSHELRTPLARIRMGIELKKDSKEIERDIAELDGLIDEILLASRLDAAPPLAKEDVDLLGLAAEECARYENVSLEGDHVTVSGDARLLRRLLRNLLENAVRHGKPPVSVFIRKNRVQVRDAGEPIPAAERQRLFEPFYRRPGSTKATGSGLGLSIVRQIARQHGGDARYEEGGFVVTLG
jgi:two-component system, OmpR family, sensor histidine kinase RstB